MGFIWTVLAAAVAVAVFWMGARWVAGGRSRRKAILSEERNEQGVPRRSLGANVNPSQLGNEADLWPDRTGPRTRRELGARHAADVTFTGDREEHKGRGHTATQGQQQGQGTAAQEQRAAAGMVSKPPEDTARQPAKQAAASKPGVRREIQPGPHEHGPGTNPAADLAPEDEFGEDRPANRTTAPDAPPTQWHPDQHGVPGDHYREGHHRSATAPETQSDATDPYAHAPFPGPNHIIPESGSELPSDVRP
jgi:hypothetical protein